MVKKKKVRQRDDEKYTDIHRLRRAKIPESSVRHNTKSSTMTIDQAPPIPDSDRAPIPAHALKHHSMPCNAIKQRISYGAPLPISGC